MTIAMTTQLDAPDKEWSNVSAGEIIVACPRQMSPTLEGATEDALIAHSMSAEEEWSNVSAGEIIVACPRQMSPALEAASEGEKVSSATVRSNTAREKYSNVSAVEVIGVSSQKQSVALKAISEVEKAPTVTESSTATASSNRPVRKRKPVRRYTDESPGTFTGKRQDTLASEHRNSRDFVKPTAESTYKDKVTAAEEDESGGIVPTRMLDIEKLTSKTKISTARRKRNPSKHKIKDAALDGMLSTTHVMVAKGSTSQITRCAVGQAILHISTKRGTFKKQRKKEQKHQKRLAAATKVHVAQTTDGSHIKTGNFRTGEHDASEFEDKYYFLRGSKDHTPHIPAQIKLEKEVKKTCWIDVEDSLKIVDSIRGCTTNTEHFVLIPRQAAISERMMGKNGAMQQQLFRAFEELEARSPPTDIRKKAVKRIMMPDGEESKYIVIGTSPKRYGKGSQECMKGFDHVDAELHRNLFRKWFRRVEHCAKKYLPWYLQDLLAKVRDICNGSTTMPLDNQRSSDIWPALAVGRNVFLNVHTDIDYFWTLISVVANEPPCENGPIICYMCFPTIGTAVALRNGDLLMFNPLVPHCVSTRCDKNKEAYCVSMYMKSLLVGGSDNDQLISQEQEGIAEFVLRNCTNR